MSKKKNTTTPTPHDAAFRSFLANPDVVNAKIIGRFSPFLMSAIGH
ncbi:hypothetical protein ABCV09_004899 [Escherichia coli]